jgi:hypothetical protein
VREPAASPTHVRPRLAGALTLACATLLASDGCAPALLALRAVRRAASARTVVLDEPVLGDTRHPDARVRPRCAHNPDGPPSDQGWTFVAPASGPVTAHVRALHDATVSVFEGEGELGCDDDGAALGESRFTFIARRGRRYLVVVDGYRGARGPYELALSRAR